MIHVVGARRTPLKDFYHALLLQRWPVTFLVIAAGYVAANAAFALAYWLTGGIENARTDSYADAFVFSVQTMGTIGYGSMFPTTWAAHALVVTESIVGLIITALATGLVFAKFSRPTARILFSREATVSPMNGVPTLMIRVGNQRGNRIVDAQFRITLARTEITDEGVTFYRTTDLVLARERALSLSRSWSVLHPIDERSPLYGLGPAELREQEAELQVLVLGLDDTTMQPVHAGAIYGAAQILYGARHADVLKELEGGDMLLDLRRFHDVEPTEATEEFPHKWRRPES